MKKLLLLTLLITSCVGDKVLTIGANKAMCISGKGPGQDGAINPYLGIPHKAIVKNLGDNAFSARIELQEVIQREISIEPNSVLKIDLEPEEVLLFDTEKTIKAKVIFRKR